MLNPPLRILLLVLLLWLSGLGAAGQFAKIAVPFDMLAQAYPDAAASLGLVLSVISLFGILFGMTAGIVVARVGYRRMLVLGLCLGAAMSLWQAALPPIVPMLVSRTIEGLSHLAIVVAAPTLMAQISSDRYRNLAMTLWSTFFGVSFAIVAWVGLPWAQVHGLKALFLAHGLAMAALAAMVWLVLKPDDPTTGAKVGSITPRKVLRQHLSVYSSPRLAAPAVGWLFYTLTFVSLVAILPFLLPADLRATIVGLMPLTSIAVSLLVATALMRIWSAIGVVVFGFALSALVLAGYWLGVSAPILCVTLFGTLGLVQGASFAAIPQLNTSIEHRALANGAMAQMGNLGNTLGTPIFLFVLGRYQFGGLVSAVILCYLAGIIVHIWLWRRRSLMQFR